jgi:hypothetical protein
LFSWQEENQIFEKYTLSACSGTQLERLAAHSARRHAVVPASRIRTLARLPLADVRHNRQDMRESGRKDAC